jgi:transaldolase / glucose-6-phosphate isomerase
MAKPTARSDRPSPTTPLQALQHLGQSPWHDNITRGLLVSKALKTMVLAGDITGLTSNPTIFEQAISRGADYDADLAKLVRKGRTADEIVDTLMIDDIRGAADVFMPVYKRTKGADGFVSIEVAPRFANDTAATVREAHRLWRAVHRANLMVKIPATKAGVAAIEQCIADGLSINVTLIFSLDRYEEVIDAYQRGIIRRAEAGKPIDRISSVASFFVSRVDSAVDKALERLKGRAAIANAKLAYALFQRKFASQAFRDLMRSGARVQRPLWASTSTKNPAYPDVYYVEALIGRDTVDTMPPQTLAAYKDHGRPSLTLGAGLDEAQRVMAQLAEFHVDIDAITTKLEVDGVASFSASFESLVAVVAARRDAVTLNERTATALGPRARTVRDAMTALDAAHFGERLWKLDPTLWKPNDAAAQTEIAVRLGWLALPRTMRAQADDLRTFADELRTQGFTHALLCGMGGSSLAPEVFRKTFGVAKGYLDLAVLDSTDPAAVRAAIDRSDPAKTLYVISSKSGGTAEVNAFFQACWQRVNTHGAANAGRHFIAITDPGTSLEQLARTHGFRRIFSNPPDIGGRYSALSYFGLVPAALLGIDVGKLLDRAARMARACSAMVPAVHNPGLALGAILGSLGKLKRDKVTLLAADRFRSFGGWVEQLVAESTGKEDRGLVPVPDEPPGTPRVYGSDRLFVSIHGGSKMDRAGAALARAGHPVWAASSCGGKSPRSWPGGSSKSTRSTSPTSRTPRPRPSNSWRSTRAPGSSRTRYRRAHSTRPARPPTSTGC